MTSTQRRLSRFLVLALLAAPASPMLLHGPQPRGPGAPSPVLPSPPGASTGGAVAPTATTGGARRSRPSTTSGANTRPSRLTRPSAPQARTANTSQGVAFNTLSWEFWWQHNRNSILAEWPDTARLPVSGSSGALTGRGRREAATRPEAAALRETIIAALQALLRNQTEAELCDSATLALARVARAGDAPRVGGDIRRELLSDTLSVKTSATLSLGVLGSSGSLPLLNGLMTDSSMGRHAIGGGRVPWQIRAYAALSLGLIHDALAVGPLVDTVLDATASERELRVAAVTALGLMDNEARQDAVAGLMLIVNTRSMDAYVRAHAITSLGRLRDPSVLPALLRIYRDRDSDDVVRQSVAIAFGRLARPDDADVVEALTDALDHQSDAATRQFGLIALARIGSRHADPDTSGVDPAIARTLRHQVSDPHHALDRSWAALATALLARSAPPADRQMAQDVLAAEYGDAHDPSVKAALALALGLMEARQEAPDVLEDLRSSRDDSFRGYAAVGLGLLGYAPAADEIISMCTDTGASDTVRLQAARALGLMHDPDVVPVLVDALTATSSLDLAWSLGRALGQVRDPASVDPLLTLAADGQRSVLSRAFACVAVGLIGEKHRLRFNTAIEEDYNFLAPVIVLNEVVNL